MADTIDYDKMAEAIARALGGGGSGGTGKDGPRNIEDFKKQIKESTEALKKQVPMHKQMEGLLKGQRQAMIDLDKELEDLDKQIEGLVGTVDSADKVLLQQERDQKASAMAINNAKAATTNFAITMGDVAQTLIKGAFQYAKDLQSGASGVEAGTNAAVTAAEASGNAISSFGSALSAAGPIVGMVAKSFASLAKYAGWIGAVISLAGIGLEVFGKKAASISSEGMKFFGEELKKTQKAFKDITDTGAVFGGGMTELRNIAADAGLDVTQLATAAKNSKDALAILGMGLGEGTKRIAGVSKELRTSELGIQLRKLGYSAEEQASLAAELMANQKAAGIGRVQSDKSVAEQTAAYGKDLKILADITGQDAKKAAEKARITSMQADIMAKLGPKEAERFQAQLRGMPEALQKGFIQYVASGGEAVTDAATNILMAQQPEVKKAFDQGLNNIRDTSKTASDVQQEALEARGRLGEAERARARSGNAVINMVNTLGTGVSTAVSSTAELTNSLILQTQANEEAAKQSKANADAAAKNTAPLDEAIAGIEENTQKLKAAMGKTLLDPITKYAETQAAAIRTVESELKRLGIEDDVAPKKEAGFNERFGGAAGGAMGGIATGAIMGGALGPVGALVGGIIGGLAGDQLGSWIGKKFDEPQKFATGGIVDGPTRAILGEAGLKEAVIPLPNGKSIPLDLDVGAITNSMAEIAMKAVKMTPMGMAASALTNVLNTNQPTTSSSDDQVAVLRDILETLNSSRDLQQQYVYNTYN